jgi:hypothetical protein
MNDSTPTPAETGNATAPPSTHPVLLELDMFETPAPFEARSLVARILENAQAITMACDAAALPSTVTCHVSMQLHDCDIEYFEQHPTRRYRYRSPMQGEQLLTLCGEADPVNFVVVRQLYKGARVLCPGRLTIDEPPTTAERFNRDRAAKSLDNDLVLEILFNSFCARPGCTLDARILLEAVGKFRPIENAARALKFEAPAS